MTAASSSAWFMKSTLDRRSQTSPAVLSCHTVSALRQAESARRRVFSNLTFRSASLTDSHSPAYELQT